MPFNVLSNKRTEKNITLDIESVNDYFTIVTIPALRNDSTHDITHFTVRATKSMD